VATEKPLLYQKKKGKVVPFSLFFFCGTAAFFFFKKKKAKEKNKADLEYKLHFR